MGVISKHSCSSGKQMLDILIGNQQMKIKSVLFKYKQQKANTTIKSLQKIYKYINIQQHLGSDKKYCNEIKAMKFYIINYLINELI